MQGWAFVVCTHTHTHTLSYTDTRSRRHTHNAHTHLLPSLPLTRTHPHFYPPGAQSLLVQGPLVPPLSCSPVHPLASGEVADINRQQAPRRQVCWARPCLFVVALGNGDSALPGAQTGQASGASSGATLVTSGHWLCLLPCPSHILCPPPLPGSFR